MNLVPLNFRFKGEEFLGRICSETCFPFTLPIKKEGSLNFCAPSSAPPKTDDGSKIRVIEETMENMDGRMIM